MSSRDDRRSARPGSDYGRSPTKSPANANNNARTYKDQPSRPGSRGGGKSYSEMRYQAGRGDGRRGAARDRDRDDGSRDPPGPGRPGSKGDGDKKEKEKDTPTKRDPATPGPEKVKVIPVCHVKSAADLEAQWQREEEDKRRQEEQKQQEEDDRRTEEERQKQEEERVKREEEERARQEEDQKRLEEEEKQRIIQEEKKCINDFVSEAAERIREKMSLRESNMNAAETRPEESFFSRLDSSLKKNTAFVRKLRIMSESQKESLTKDLKGLNLTKYVGEVAAAITEAKLKMSDIGCAVHLCSLMHQRYAEYSPNLMENWQKYMVSKKDEKLNNPSKYRVDLRFYGELVAVGVFRAKEGLTQLANQLSWLINNDKEGHSNLTILTSFCKHCGDDYAGLLSRKYRKLAEKYELEVPRSNVLPPERHKGCRNLLRDYYTSLCKHLCKDHKELKTMEKQNRKQIMTKGELSEEKKARYEEAYTTYQKLLGNMTVFADLLDEDLPDLPEEDLKQDDEGGLDIFNPLKNVEFQYEGDSALFEDEETRTFYESLPDLKASIPGILYKESETTSSKDDCKDEDLGIEEDLENLDIEEVEREMETQKEIAESEGGGDDDKKQDPGALKEGETAMEQLGLLPPIVEELFEQVKQYDDDTGSIMKIQFEQYAQSLPTCVNRDLIDKAAIEFCMNFNTKTNRKKLVRALFTVHRTRYDLLPFYGRFVATLYPCMPDVANDLVQLLKGDFRWHVRKKDQINIESKLKTVRFIGEMVKFKLYPKSEVLHCVKMLLFDFSHHNIEMACSLLEACGRYLYRSLESHHRTRVYLDVMMRKKAALLMDSRYTTMIENAFYYSNPPDVAQIVRKERPPMHEYIRRLLYKDLSKVTTEKVLRQMRKLDWDDEEIRFYATKCMIAVWQIRFNSVHCAANLLAGIAPYHEHVAIQVVDGVLEDIRLGMEINHPRYNQRRVSCAKYLGELYNYRMVESAVVFKILYSFITFGVSTQDGAPSMLDPPEHLFRNRLVCVVLDTCGQYFDKGSSKRKLDCFLVYFQRYYWFKRSLPEWSDTRPFPVDVENLFRDTLEAVRPKLRLVQNFEDACKACEELENEFKPRVASLLPIIETAGDTDASELDDSGLAVINESEEYSDASQSHSQNPPGDESETSMDDAGSQSQSQNDSRMDYYDGEDVEGDDEYTDSDAALDEDEILVMKSGPKHIECTEDEDFMAAFDKMLDDNNKARNQESLKVPQFDVAVPMQLKAVKGKKFELNPEPKEDRTITFTLMTKRGNKQQFADLNVPMTAEFATKYKVREQQERVEKERMKQVVLGIHERQEEEDYQESLREMIASLSRPLVNSNRERKVKYQHPKGAPDADAIFGSKKW